MASQPKNLKVLVVGSANGAIRSLFGKVSAINSKHGPFDYLFCTGDLFAREISPRSESPVQVKHSDDSAQGNSLAALAAANLSQATDVPAGGKEQTETERDLTDLLEGRIEVPIPAYFTFGSRGLPERVKARIQQAGGEVCSGLTFLGKQSVFTMADGLRVGTFGGDFDQVNLEKIEEDGVDPLSVPHFTSSNVASFATSLSNLSSKGKSKLQSTDTNPSPSIDILLTHAFPTQITQLSSKPLPAVQPESTPATLGSAVPTSFGSTGGGPKGLEHPGRPAGHQPVSPLLTSGSPSIAEVIKTSQPRYHFASGLKAFWEREPFKWPIPPPPSLSPDQPLQLSTPQLKATRFLTLGEFGNPNKERWFYAFNIQVPAPSVATPIPNATTSPFAVSPFAVLPAGKGQKNVTQEDEDAAVAGKGKKREWAGSDFDAGENFEGGQNFIFGLDGGGGRGDGGRRNKKGKGGPPPDTYTCKICNTPGHWIQDCPEKERVDRERAESRAHGPPRKEIGPDECWFCLSNAKVTKHLIASIGSETYLTLPKGQLPIPPSPSSTSSSSPVPGGGHVLIIPIAHYPTFGSIPPDALGPVQEDMNNYKSALRKMYDKFGAKMVSWEIAREGGKGGHAHVQVCPVPSELADKVEDIFRSEGEAQGIAFEEGSDEIRSGSYFRLDLPDGRILIHQIRPHTRFDLQYPRATLAKALGIPERTDWKACAGSDAEEKADCQAFKKAFTSFDPTA